MTNVVGRIPVGSRVVISGFGKEHYGICPGESGNPLGVEGVTVAVGAFDYEDGFIYKVNWDNGFWNVYEEGTIELVVKDLTNI